MSSDSGGASLPRLGNLSARHLALPPPIMNQSSIGIGQADVVTSLGCDVSPIFCSTKWLAVVVVVEVAFGAGCSLDFEASKDRTRFGPGFGIAALVHFLLKPLVMFAWIKIFNFFYAAVVALIVTMSLPGGHAAFFLTFLVCGDAAQSAIHSVVFSLLSTIFLPFNLFVYASHWLLGKHVIEDVIAYPSIILAFLLMIIPLGVGALIAKLRPRVAKITNKVFHVILLLTLISFVVLAAIEEQEALKRFEPNELWLACGLTPLIGIICGILLTALMQQDSLTRRTVAVDTMTQNGPLAAAILKIVFPSNFIGIYYLLPLLYSLLQFLEALVFVGIVRYKLKKEEEEKENAFFALGGVPVGRIRRISLHTIDRIRRSFTRSSRSSDISDHAPSDLQHDDNDEQEVFTMSARRHNLLTMAIAEEEEEQSASSYKRDSKKKKKERNSGDDLQQNGMSSMSKEELSQFEDVSITKSD